MDKLARLSRRAFFAVEAAMTIRVYDVVRDDWGWAYRSPEHLSRTFATQEAAILSAMGELRREIAEGHEAELTVEGRKLELPL